MQSPTTKPITVRNWLAVSAVAIFAYHLALLSPSTFFARDDQSGPALYWLTMPIRVLVYPVSFIVLPFSAALLTLLAWALVLLCAPLIWMRNRAKR